MEANKIKKLDPKTTFIHLYQRIKLRSFVSLMWVATLYIEHTPEPDNIRTTSHEPRAVTTKLREPKRKCPKAVPKHLHIHAVWSRTLKCNVKSYVSGPSIKCYFNGILFMRVLTHGKIE